MAEEFDKQQYDLLSKEVLEIHSRSDKLEQFFLITIGGLYGFAFVKAPELESVIFLVPIFVSYFAFVRLELLSRVRSIIREKQIELENQINNEEGQGVAQHFQKRFYDENEPNTDRKVGFLTLFKLKVSDRAAFWRFIFVLAIAAAGYKNWESLKEIFNWLCL